MHISWELTCFYCIVYLVLMALPVRPAGRLKNNVLIPLAGPASVSSCTCDSLPRPFGTVGRLLQFSEYSGSLSLSLQFQRYNGH